MTPDLTTLVVGTAGHIDHGKSSLVRALTGTDPDRLQEEKVRGITIDLGFAHTVEGRTILSFVDVPGHERFVKNMLAGVGGIDLVMLHVAADESVMPQTREHFDICRLLQVPAGLVVITKVDLVDEDMLDVVRMEIQDLVAGSFLEGAPILPVSARTGAGLEALRATLVAMAAETARRPSGAAPRLPIDRVFSVRGFGTVATGTLIGGWIAVDDELVLAPGGRAVKVRGLQVHGRPERQAAAGQRVAVNLAGVEVSDLARGETLTSPDGVTVTRRADVMLELLPSARPLRHAARVRFHQGTSERHGRIALPDAVLEPGSSGFARVNIDAPAALVRGDRFILRSASPVVTIGGGIVLDPLPPRRGVRTPAALRRFDGLAHGSPDDAAMTVAAEAGLRGLPCVQLRSRLGMNEGEAEGVITRLQQRGVVVRVGDVMVEASRLDAAAEEMLRVVGEHHAANPLEEGIPREELRERLFSAAAPGVFEHVLATLASAGKLVARDRVARRGHTLALTEEEAAARDAMVRVLEAAGLAPPDGAELVARVGAPRAIVDRVAQLLVRQRTVVRVGGLLFHGGALERLKKEVQGLKRQHATDRIDVGTFKERYQVTRKYAIPLLEFLDRERVTKRVGDERQIL